MMKNQPTIMQVLPSLKQGGVETGTIEIAAALTQAKINNIVVSNGGPMVKQLDKLGVKHFRIHAHSKNPFIIWINAHKIAKIATENHVDLIHVRSRAPAWSVKLASHRTGIPYIASYHGIYGIHPKLKKIYNRVMLSGKCVIAVSDYVQQHLLDEYHYPKNKIHVIHRGADLNRFNPALMTQDKVNSFIHKYQIPVEQPIITLVGRLSKIKGQNLLLQALSQMKNQELTCLLVGGKAKPEYEQQLKEIIRTLPQTITVKTISVPANEIPIVYQISDAVVSASIVPETFGRTIAEAGAMKRIVIAFNHGGPQEIIQHNKTGFLIPVGDVSQLAKTLDDVLDMSPTQKKKMEEQAYQHTVKNFSVQKMCDQTLKLYREILHAKTK